MKEPIIKTCEACGQSFTCGGYGCWCAQVQITERQMDWIAARFQNCLCPECLKKVSRGELGPSISASVRIPDAQKTQSEDSGVG